MEKYIIKIKNIELRIDGTIQDAILTMLHLVEEPTLVFLKHEDGSDLMVLMACKNLLVEYVGSWVPFRKFVLLNDEDYATIFFPPELESDDWDKVFNVTKKDIENILGEHICDPDFWLIFKNELLANYKELPDNEEIISLYNALKIIQEV